MSNKTEKPKGYKPGPQTTLHCSNEELLRYLAASSDPLTQAAIREVLYLRREVERLQK